MLHLPPKSQATLPLPGRGHACPVCKKAIASHRMGKEFIYAMPCNHPLQELSTGRSAQLIQAHADPQRELLTGVHQIEEVYRLSSRANERVHWSKKHKMNKLERGLGWGMCKVLLGNIPPYLPLKITLTRIAPRKLDRDDNLPMAFKAIKDGICDYLCVDDRTEGILWVYAQGKPDTPKSYYVRIKVEPGEERHE